MMPNLKIARRHIGRHALTAVTCAALCTLIGGGQIPARAGESQQDEETRLIRQIGENNPTYMNALPPVKVPQPVLDKAHYWMTTIIKSKWLDKDLPKRFVPLKNVKTWEKRDPKGYLVDESVGDYIVAEYVVDGHRFYLQDDGCNLHIRIDPPEPVDVSGDPAPFVRQCVEKFLDFPTDRSKDLTLDLHRTGSLVYGKAVVKVELPPLSEDEKNAGYTFRRWWWQEITVCTNGTFFFASVMEADGKPLRPRARPGPPNRF